MSQLSITLSIFLIFINVFTFFLVWHDKKRARAKGWRVPESRFFILAFLGGAVGVYSGMRIFHHKTKHTTFTIGIPILIILNIIIYYFLY